MIDISYVFERRTSALGFLQRKEVSSTICSNGKLLSIEASRELKNGRVEAAFRTTGRMKVDRYRHRLLHSRSSCM